MSTGSSLMCKFRSFCRGLFGIPVLAAAMVLTMPCLVAGAEGSCIVSGDITRDSAASESVGFEVGSWFDSSSFAIEIAPCLGDFNSYPNGALIILR